MFDGIKTFFFNDIRTKILDEHTKENILNIVESMLKLTMPEKAIHEELLPKISVIINEVLINIFKYEEKPIFKIIFKIKSDSLVLSIQINGETLDIKKVMEKIDYLSKINDEDLIFLNGLGIYNCYKVSDDFSIIELDNLDNYFCREINCFFNLLERGVFL